MLVKDILELLLDTDYKIESYWANVEYNLTEDIENSRIERILVKDNKLIITI